MPIDTEMEKSPFYVPIEKLISPIGIDLPCHDLTEEEIELLRKSKQEIQQKCFLVLDSKGLRIEFRGEPNASQAMEED
jgi:hypothetical protein